MNRLKNTVVTNRVTTVVRQLACIGIMGACLLLPTAGVHAQSEKQISYPVAVPIERAPAATATAAIIKAPEPVIRPASDAATPPAREPASKKTVERKKTKTVSKSTATKTTANKSKTLKKPLVEKSLPKKNSIKTTTTAKNTKAVVKKSTVVSNVKKNTVTNSNLNTEKALPSSIPADKPSDRTASAALLPTAVKAGLAPVALATVVEPAMADDMPITSGLDEEDIPTGPELDQGSSPGAVSSPSDNSVANAPIQSTAKIPALPMSNQQEKFVLEFKNYVETRIVPRVPGVALAIIADGKVKILQAYGVKKVGTNDPINTDTAFRLASVSKTIAGTTAGVLVNDGLISWDTPITSVLPTLEFSNPRYGNQLTLRNIMSQSSGLPTHAGDNYIEEGLPFDSVVQKLKSVNFVCPPGKCYTYQNVTMSLLASIVYKKTGKTYEQYVKEKLFMPLGMRSASIGLEGLLATKNYAMPHELTARGKWYTKEITQHYYRLNPAAGGNASINDMARWILAHMGQNPDVLPPSTLQAVHAKVTKNTAAQSHYGAREGVTDTHYGMGWRTFDYRGDKNFLHHGGYVFGSRSEMVFNPELKIGMVILSNSNKLPGQVVFEFLDAYEDEKRGPRALSLPSPVKKAKKKATK